ncbi:hypothetical protein A1OE_275 [Candidatus Endolissoclinum faulkneri L2]|uniref:Uncharacterized protein n=1 Tax=Candidatus Endolissoclinum faulkneri L2 TaxID=1193729 RepID=K7YFW7_9PROT|nr:hypothetical protein A1OE_275 [Candidatus Endolissoclinum faulkneri L2]
MSIILLKWYIIFVIFIYKLIISLNILLFLIVNDDTSYLH